MANLGYVQLARGCNQRCLFCSNPPNGLVLEYGQACERIDDLVRRGYHGVILTGGEPTLFERVPDLIRYAHERGLPSRIITNGQKTARPEYMKRLVDAGLTHIHLSIHSWKEEVHDRLTQTKGSLRKQIASLRNAETLGITADINCVINRHNADHLHENVQWLVKRFPFLHHFVWNNMDPSMNPDMNLPDLLPRMRDFEISLHKAMQFLERTGRTFRAERVPLCYMTEYAHCSTETRKIVKKEERTVHFLDHTRGLVVEQSFDHGKAPVCGVCRYTTICAGLFMYDRYYDPNELSPVFLDPQEVIDRILKDREQNPDAPEALPDGGPGASGEPAE